jgi:DNA-binding CsgD family transcriptional regulator
MFTQPQRANEVEAPLTVIRLTKREIEVLSMVSEGLTSQQVAEKLFVSTRTVNYHLAGVFAKLKVRNRIQAIVVAGRLGLIRTEQLFGNGRGTRDRTSEVFAPDRSAEVESYRERMRMYAAETRSPRGDAS